MKIWIDDLRPAPEGYVWCKSVNEAINCISGTEEYISGALDELDYRWLEEYDGPITLIDIDHDAGDYACDGGDYIKVLDWLEATGRNYPIKIHSMNTVGVLNMRRIIEKNGWMEVRR